MFSAWTCDGSLLNDIFKLILFKFHFFITRWWFQGQVLGCWPKKSTQVVVSMIHIMFINVLPNLTWKYNDAIWHSFFQAGLYIYIYKKHHLVYSNRKDTWRQARTSTCSLEFCSQLVEINLSQPKDEQSTLNFKQQLVAENPSRELNSFRTSLQNTARIFGSNW